LVIGNDLTVKTKEDGQKNPEKSQGIVGRLPTIVLVERTIAVRQAPTVRQCIGGAVISVLFGIILTIKMGVIILMLGPM
jgi:hypothetical protein